MEFKFEDLIPKTGEFTLSQLPNHTIKLKPFSAADEIWLLDRFGGRLQEIFLKAKVREICEIAFHQMEDKTPFIKQEVDLVDEEGNVSKQSLGGVSLLMALILPKQELEPVIMALMQTIGVSRPMVEKQYEEDQKKKQIGLK